jgi:ABC-type uncharacterized transport system ATPase subunit
MNQSAEMRMSVLPQTASETSATPAEQILRVSNIEVVYNHMILVLKGVSLDVPRGAIVALLKRIPVILKHSLHG